MLCLVGRTISSAERKAMTSIFAALGGIFAAWGDLLASIAEAIASALGGGQ